MAIAMMKPGITTADIAGIWPRAQEFGFPNEEACFGLQYGHGVGLSVWEQPVISRLVSLDHPVTIEAGMVIALETFWPASDGWSAARIEEEVLVTETGHEVITRFPAETLLVAGAPYWTGTGPLNATRGLEAGLGGAGRAARGRARLSGARRAPRARLGVGARPARLREPGAAAGAGGRGRGDRAREDRDIDPARHALEPDAARPGGGGDPAGG